MKDLVAIIIAVESLARLFGPKSNRYDFMTLEFLRGQFATMIIKKKYLLFSKKLMMWKSIKWLGLFVKEVLVDREESCILINGVSENFIFWLILVLSA